VLLPENNHSLLDEHGKEAKLCAGATDLKNLMRMRSVTPRYLIYTGGLKELDYIKFDDQDGLRIGALCTLTSVQQSDIVKKSYQALHEAVCQMGSVQTRNMATIAGNICRASPSADTASPLMALSAKLKVVGPDGPRVIPGRGFFTGPGLTVLTPDEMVIEIQVPKLPDNTGTAFLKAKRTAVDVAIANAATVLRVRHGFCEDAAIAIGGVAPTPVRAEKAEETLKGKKIDAELVEKASIFTEDVTRCISDARAPAGYRDEMSKVLVKRALNIALERAC